MTIEKIKNYNKEIGQLFVTEYVTLFAKTRHKR